MLAGASPALLGPISVSRYDYWPALLSLLGIAALVLVRRPDVTAPRGPPIQVATATPPALDVQVPAGQSVAVFQTPNPNAVGIWTYVPVAIKAACRGG